MVCDRVEEEFFHCIESRNNLVISGRDISGVHTFRDVYRKDDISSSNDCVGSYTEIDNPEIR
jgi:hypothetical protein